MNEVVLVNHDWRPFLYAVERETGTRVYGFVKDQRYHSPKFVPKPHVLKRNATEADLQAVRTAMGERTRRKSEADAWYRKRLDEIAGRAL